MLKQFDLYLSLGDSRCTENQNCEYISESRKACTWAEGHDEIRRQAFEVAHKYSFSESLREAVEKTSNYA